MSTCPPSRPAPRAPPAAGCSTGTFWGAGSATSRCGGSRAGESWVGGWVGAVVGWAAWRDGRLSVRRAVCCTNRSLLATSGQQGRSAPPPNPFKNPYSQRAGYGQAHDNTTCAQACPAWTVDCGTHCASPRAGCISQPRDVCQLGELKGCSGAERCVRLGLACD